MAKQEVARSTYSTSYRPVETWRPVRYKDTPSFVSGTLKNGHLQEVPEQLGPRRQQEFEYGPGLGLGHSAVNTTRFLDPKPITGTQYPSNERQDNCSMVAKDSPLFRNSDPFDDDAYVLPGIRLAAVRGDVCGKLGTNDFDQSAWRYVWDSTATRAAREGHLPTVTDPQLEGVTEPRADQVCFDPRKYEDTPAEWQQAYIWDRIQVRPPPLARRPSARPKKMTRTQTEDVVDMDTAKVDQIKKLAQENKLSSIYTRKCPGYAAYIPRLPINGPMERPNSGCRGQILSNARATHREIPRVPSAKRYGRKGQFSKMVTLTFPYNPFREPKQTW